jgi:hypothetical protein
MNKHLITFEWIAYRRARFTCPCGWQKEVETPRATIDKTTIADMTVIHNAAISLPLALDNADPIKQAKAASIHAGAALAELCRYTREGNALAGWAFETEVAAELGRALLLVIDIELANPNEAALTNFERAVVELARERIKRLVEVFDAPAGKGAAAVEAI